jgi:hypothetical protein
LNRNSFYYQNKVFKSALEWLRFQFNIRFLRGLGNEKILINSIPKSGTHLLTEVLSRSGYYKNSGLHIKTWKVNTLSDGPEYNDYFQLDQVELEQYFKRIKNGQYCSAHLPYDKNIITSARKYGITVIFLKRNLLDILISEHNYIKELKRHFKYNEFKGLTENESYCHLLAEGFNDRMYRFDGWLKEANFVVTFEDLSNLNESKFANFFKENLGIKLDLEKIISKSKNTKTATKSKKTEIERIRERSRIKAYLADSGLKLKEPYENKV